MELHRTLGALWGSPLAGRRLTMKAKGQLGAAQDSFTLETKMLARKNTFSAASHFWHDSPETEGEAAHPGSRDPAQPQLTELPPPWFVKPRGHHSRTQGWAFLLPSAATQPKTGRSSVCLFSRNDKEHGRAPHPSHTARWEHPHSTAGSPFPQEVAQTLAQQQPGPASSDKPRFVFSIRKALI